MEIWTYNSSFKKLGKTKTKTNSGFIFGNKEKNRSRNMET